MKIQNYLFLILLTLWTVSCSNQDEISTVIPSGTVEKDEVSIDEAQENLEGILATLTSNTRANSRSIVPKVTSRFSTKGLVSRGGKNDAPFVYVLNIGDKNGYAIMSSDRRLPSLLALVDSGELKPNSIIENPDQLIFLTNTSNYVNSVLASGVGIPNKKYEDGDHLVTGNWTTTMYDIPEISCKVKWGQDGNYSKYCPYIIRDDTSKHAYTGCIATATAQLMSIYKYPTNFRNYTFNWDKMTKKSSIYNFYSENDTTTINQIARLMQLLGVKENLNMQYESNGSNAHIEDIPQTLLNMGYQNGGICKDYVTSDVVNELQNKYPVIVTGSDIKTVKRKRILGITVKTETSYTGHAWLLNGLLKQTRNNQMLDKDGNIKYEHTETNWYVLCNFGWEGSCDGYYLSYSFDVNKGPAFKEQTRAAAEETENTTISGTDNYYQYKLKQLSGIRK